MIVTYSVRSHRLNYGFENCLLESRQTHSSRRPSSNKFVLIVGPIMYLLNEQIHHFLSQFPKYAGGFFLSSFTEAYLTSSRKWLRYLFPRELLPFWPYRTQYPYTSQSDVKCKIKMPWPFLMLSNGFSFNLGIKFKLWAMI